MNNYSFDKFIPSFGSEILDVLYKETPIIQGDLDAFLKLPLNEGYKKNQEAKEITIEKSEPVIELGVDEPYVKDFISLSQEDFKSSIKEE
jgi:hypothetical protein